MFVAKFPGSTYATQAMNAGPRQAPPLAGERPLGRREHARLARKGVLRVDVTTGGLRFGSLLDLHATPISSASSREIACSTFPTRTTIGPPNGSTRHSLTFLPGTSSSFER